MAVRTRNIFDPKSTSPFKLSRSKLEKFLNCPRCFYLDRRLGIDQPSGPAFTLNSAVDHLFKKEFNTYRTIRKPHPIMTSNGVDAVPFIHPELETWRANFTGIQVLHQPTNFNFFGAVDDIWEDSQGRLIVVDYKSTSKDEAVSLEGKWQQAYKRQVEIYQWLLKQRGFVVNDMAYFVYANGRKSEDSFGGQLLFDIALLSHKGDCSWVDQALIKAKECLMADSLPPPPEECEYCQYRRNCQRFE